MRHFKITQETVAKQICTKIICNRCKKEIDIPDNGWNPDSNNFHDFDIGGGYGTYFPTDMEQIEFTLCGECLKEITDAFAIPPTSSYDEEIK